MNFLKTFLLVAFCAVLSGCVAKQASVQAQKNLEYTQTGMASWYGQRFHGKKTASGDRYNMHAFTCAHRSLPFGTQVLVTNLSNLKSVEVTVNDRGPFIKGRIIDLSYVAAKKLDFIRGGKTQVKIHYQLTSDVVHD